MRYSRRLITYEKQGAYNAAAAAEYHAAHPDPTLAIDRIHDIVFDSYGELFVATVCLCRGDAWLCV